MRTFGFVTSDTRRLGIAVLVFRFMAALALKPVMFAQQRKIRVLVPERGFIQWDDIRVAPFMIGMAVGAFPSFGVSIAPMKALAGLNVAADILMTFGT